MHLIIFSQLGKTKFDGSGVVAHSKSRVRRRSGAPCSLRDLPNPEVRTVVLH